MKMDPVTRDAFTVVSGGAPQPGPFRRPAWIDPSEYPFTDRFVEVDGCRVHYVDEGDGPPLLFLHGNPTWSFVYRNLIRSLRHRFRCIALDYPGFGLSTARDGYDFRIASHAGVVAQFIRALDLRGLTLMVHDWGGPIGLTAAVRDPGRFRALLVGNTIAWRVNGKPRFEIFSRLMGGRFGHWLNVEKNFFVKVMIPANTKKASLSEGVKAAYAGPFPTASSREPIARMPREVLGATDLLRELEHGMPRLRNLPALLLWGDRDIAFKEAERRRFEELLPNHRTLILAGAGHYIQEDAHEEIVRAIEEWWPTAAGEGGAHA